MVWDINWYTNDPAVLKHPFYITYSVKTLSEISDAVNTIKSQLGGMLASKESAAIIAYGCWLLRVAALRA